MSDESTDLQNGNDSLSELKQIIEELNEEVTEQKRNNIFKMAEFLFALDIKVEACQIEMSDGSNDLGLVVPMNQFNNLRKALLDGAI
jgi:uncharacterized coiled-coil protein SlyX